MVPELGPPDGDPALGIDDPVLPGEDPGSADPEDVEHWVAVYRELVEGIRAAWRDGGDGTDPLLREVFRRYARRLRFWREQQRRSERSYTAQKRPTPGPL